MEAIAIIGMGCRFPGAKDPESFWSLLWNGVDGITEVPPDRWDGDGFYDPEPGQTGKMITRCGGFLDQIDQFDADFFEMARHEVTRMDPQQRLLLEVAWEALEDAGLIPAKLGGSRTGVCVGIRQTDYSRYLYGNLARIDGKNPDNTYPCIIANRLSYLLDLHGPSMAVDTACSSALVAVHLACQSLQTSESNLVLAGGVNLNLFPEEFISRSLAGMVSASGRCKAFDATADGYVIGEGCGVVVLKRLSDALNDHDNILAVIRGSAVNHNGLSYRLTAYNGLAQQELIRQALRNAGVTPAEIGYVEANGTGSYMGDPIELKALKSVLTADPSASRLPCWIGSVKATIGHLEAASGIASLIKVVLCLQHEGIPPHLHLYQLNPQISLENTPLAIPVQRQQWPRGERKRVAGISAFGLGGANAHMIVSDASVPLGMAMEVERPKHILTLSAKCENALHELALRYQAFLVRYSDLSPGDICFTANTARSQFDHRLAIVAGSTTQLREALHAFITGNKAESSWTRGTSASRKQPELVFVFPGEAENLGRQLYQTQPTFRKAFDRCSDILHPRVRKPSSDVLYESSIDKYRDIGTHALTAFAVEYALAELWQSWGIVPAIVMGEGGGDYVAASVACVLSLEEGLGLIAERRRPGLTNSQVVCSAISESISDNAEQLHTKAMALPKYLPNNGEQPTDLVEAIKALVQQGFGIFVELGPGSIGRKIADIGLPEAFFWLSSLDIGTGDWQQMLSSLAELYVRGASVEWFGFDRDYSRRRLQLPTYPFQRKRYRLDTADSGQHKNTGPSLQDGVDDLIISLLDGGDAPLSGLWGQTGAFSQQEDLKRQVRRLALEQTRDLLSKAVKLLQEKDNLLKDCSYRAALQGQVRLLDLEQLQELLVKAVECLWRRDDLLKAYLERKVMAHEDRHWDLDYTRAALLYISELLRKKDNMLRIYQEQERAQN